MLWLNFVNPCKRRLYVKKSIENHALFFSNILQSHVGIAGHVEFDNRVDGLQRP